jgi:putative methionine-R-sulfoxide reductase with GAF domain
MQLDTQKFLTELRTIASAPSERKFAFQQLADFLRKTGNYRWVGLYDVDYAASLVKNIAWSGTGVPEYPVFPLTKGLTGAAVSSGKTINVGNVAADQRYLTAFGSTRSEIIVPVFDHSGRTVIGTIDVESESENAFDAEAQSLLELCSSTIQSLWLR